MQVAAVPFHPGPRDKNLKNVPISEVLKILESKFDCKFIFSNELVDINKKVSIKLEDKTIEEILDDIFNSSGITFKELEDNLYVLYSRDKVFNRHRVSGTVLDEKGNPLIGVNLIEAGTTNGTVTDIEGNYNITVSDPRASLLFSFVGYLKEGIIVNGQREINLTMKPDLHKLDEFVLVGYSSVRREDLTGSVEVVQVDDIKNNLVVSSEEVIQGRAAGVFVASSTGSPGSPISVRIRGIGTPNNADPLYVVDGMPIKDATFGKNDNPSGINFLNPNDIESIQILKDASAAAIYGTRGANGVVIITTKKGSNGEPRVSFNSYYGLQNLPNRLDILNGQEFATMYNEVRGEYFSPDSIPYLSTTSWQDEIFQQASTYNAQFSISGGSNKSNYYTSFNRFFQDGILKYSSFTRNSFRINSNHVLTDWFRVGQNFNLTNYFRKRQNEQGLGASGLVGSAIAASILADPTEPVYDPETEWEYLDLTSNIANPVGILERKHYHYNTNRIQGTAYTEFEFIPNLVFKFNGGIDRSWGFREEIWPSYFVGPNDANNETLLTTEDEGWFNYLLELTGNYKFALGDSHDFNILAGYSEQYEIKNRVIGASYLPSNEENMLYHEARESISDVVQLGGYPLPWALRSYIGRFDYNFRNKYLFTATMRIDGSSRFGAERRWGSFPAFSAAWKLSEEDFIKSLGILNLAKVRAGFGRTGNQNIGPFQFTTRTTYQPDPGLPGQVVYFGDDNIEYPSLFILGVANRLIGWETTTTLNIGLDLSLWSNKILTNIDFYSKRTTDLLLNIPLPNMFAVTYGNFMGNAGEVLNKGIDVFLTHQNSIKEFTYEVGGNFSLVKNEVVDLAGGAPLNSGSQPQVRMTEGEPIGVFWGYIYEGIFKSEEEIKNHATQSDARVGDLRFKDINKDGEITSLDQDIIGYALPDFTYGLNFGVGYKNLNLTMLAQGVFGNSVYNRVKAKLYNPMLTNNVSTDMLRYYGRQLDDGTVITDTDVYRTGLDRNDNQRISSYFIEDGSYLRIKSLTLSYDFMGFFKLSPITNLQAYVTVQNLYTFTDYTGYNPEIGSSTAFGANPLAFGIDNAVYPMARTVLFGINIGF
jgi:TonB-linked SusC/RagA family outer membrane protein